MEIILPKRRFASVRRVFRRYLPGFYGWALGNPTLRKAFSVIKGKEKVVLSDDPAEKFTKIYETHYWVDDESRSGGGSNLYATEKIRAAIPNLIEKYGIRSVLDVPCGDFVWFKEMNLDLDSYIGGDIVAPLIESVSRQYSAPGRSFRVLDITKDPLPDSDLILVRDCFIHLSFEAIRAALNNIMQSNIQYLLTTHYADTTANDNIEIGSFHPVNICAHPFYAPTALEFIEDSAKGARVRHIGLWLVSDLRASLELQPSAYYASEAAR